MADDQDAPELDRVPGWPMPESQHDWYGSPSAETFLARAHASGHMHHAWLLTGPKGIGKATLAFRFARYILARPGGGIDAGTTLGTDPEHRVSRQVANGAHPNLLVLRRPYDQTTRRFRTELTVGEVRRLQRFFGSTAGEPGWRICIVDPADDLNISAENALLKMLEEPPERSLFLLAAHRPGRLLPTTRSRCASLILKPLPIETITGVLSTEMPDASAADIQLAASLSGGSLRQAILGLDHEGVDLYRSFGRIVAQLPSIDYRAVHQLADTVGIRGRDAEFRGFIDVVEDWLDRRVRNTPEPLEAASPPSEAASLAAWASVWEKVQESTLQAEMLNLDRKQVVLQVFMALEHATRM